MPVKCPKNNTDDVLHKPHGKGVKKGDTAQKDQNIPFSSGFYKFWTD